MVRELLGRGDLGFQAAFGGKLRQPENLKWRGDGLLLNGTI
ncbi:hypothetical protein [Kingella oralis]|uniref:Uncharacterized protein n=1 Tax=Kingella oralis ATCC 51147 TaxID=629741 RepID=C4GG20_9NEIS|nr:hypothetical protein [Kingella oralis]EEP69175.1 hypothetical protein GCWU000324_01087 [Kingella oralis ATCC 51147]